MDRRRNKDAESKKKFFILLFIACILISITIIIVIAIFVSHSSKLLPLAESDRIECPGFNEKECSRVGCLWKKARKGPCCYMKKDSFGYKIDGVPKEGENGTEIKLSSLVQNTPYGESANNVVFKVIYITNNIVRFQFKTITENTSDNGSKEDYEVPVQKDFPLLQDLPKVNKSELNYEFNYTESESKLFHFEIKRRKGATLWNTSIGGLLLSRQYLQIASYLPSSNIYGLGEHVHDTLRHGMDFVSWPMFARDRFPSSHADQHNLYGVHPFYTCLEEDGKSHGVLFLNSNAMEATLMPAPAISFRTIGGILDFFIFIGDNPEHVIQLYTSLIGRPLLPPYWSLGFQLSQYGYNNISKLKEAVDRTRAARIPLEVQFLDIDHMSENMDFTYDNKSFSDLPQYMEEQREKHNLKWIIILDPAIAVDSNYTIWTKGLEKQVFIKRAPHWPKSMFPPCLNDFNFTFGKVWPPGYVAFPDFFKEETKEWWKEIIIEHRNVNNITFDGLWIDMNEPANFETNVERPSFCESLCNPELCKGLVCPKGQYDDPVYNPVLKITGDRLSEKTICMESIQEIDGTAYRHYDVHSLYGWSQSQPTLEAAQGATGTRSLVISRSTYPSSGRYAGHWLGDNTSNFPNMKNSIIGMLEFNMFGIPYIGADVCGFIGKADAHLCKRWMQLGAFYPFYRNHNAINEPPQDPAYFGEDVAEASRKAVERRIALNPYLYTLFYRAHVDGNTVVRPVFHEFPTDNLTWNMDEQFMWGKSLMIIPILQRNQRIVNIYLPDCEWWHFLYKKTQKLKYASKVLVEDADEYTPLAVRGGTILPIAVYDWNIYPEKDYVTTRKMDLYVFPYNGTAEGELFMDDGLSKNTIENEAYALYEFKLEQKNCKLKINSDEKKNFKGPKPHLNNILIFKAKSVKKKFGQLPVYS